MTALQLASSIGDGNHSLAVFNSGVTEVFDGKGIADLYRLYTNRPEALQGAIVADKVVGKGAAALMIAGGVKEVFARVISHGAIELFEQSDITLNYDKKVDRIINRRGDGWCPVERLCADAATAADCLPLIIRFINKQKNN